MALEDLADGYSDWRTALTPIFPGLDAIALGSVAGKGGRRAAEEDDGDPTPSPSPGG